VERADDATLSAPASPKPDHWLLRALHSVEDGLLATLVAVMILVAG
jgi:hypothetical protein